jgi:hypothetical protein
MIMLILTMYLKISIICAIALAVYEIIFGIPGDVKKLFNEDTTKWFKKIPTGSVKDKTFKDIFFKNVYIIMCVTNVIFVSIMPLFILSHIYLTITEGSSNLKYFIDVINDEYDNINVSENK